MGARSLVAAAATAVALMGGVALAAPAMADEAPPAYDLKCSNMINYGAYGDLRPNAIIDGIGHTTGTCPAPIPGARS